MMSSTNVCSLRLSEEGFAVFIALSEERKTGGENGAFKRSKYIVLENCFQNISVPT